MRWYVMSRPPPMASLPPLVGKYMWSTPRMARSTYAAALHGGDTRPRPHAMRVAFTPRSLSGTSMP